MKKPILLILLLALLLPGAAMAADDEPPTVAFLAYGRHPILNIFTKAVFDMLQEYGYINADERTTLESGSDLHGENINILNRDAGFDFPTANLMIEDALDQGADVLVTVSNEVGAIAAGAMAELEDPPALIFAIVTSPEYAGLVQSSCVKPPNVTGTQMWFDVAHYEQILFRQDPDLDAYGVLVDTSDPAHQYYIANVEDYAERYGLRAEIATSASVADWGTAAQTLIEADVDAIALMPRTADPARGIPAVINEAYGVPVYSIIVTDVFMGVTIATGFNGWYEEGHTTARMLIGHLRGDIDIARTGIATTPAVATAVNLDSAAQQDVVIAEAILADADFVVEGGEGMGVDIEIPGVTTVLEEMSLEERMAADAEFLASLHCSDDMIAEQQAALDAADG